MEFLHMGDITVAKTVSPAMMRRIGFLTDQRQKAQELEDKMQSMKH